MKNTAPCTHGEWQKLPSMACTVYHRMGHSTMNQQPHVGVSVAGQALASGCGKWLCARVTMMPLDAVVLSSTCGWPPVPPVRCTCRVRTPAHTCCIGTYSILLLLGFQGTDNPMQYQEIGLKSADSPCGAGRDIRHKTVFSSHTPYNLPSYSTLSP